jgi:hypothetical protein
MQSFAHSKWLDFLGMVTAWGLACGLIDVKPAGEKSA